MDLNISFLTFSPKVKKNNKKICVDRKIPKLCLKRKLSLSRSKGDSFHDKWASPSSLDNVHKNIQLQEPSGSKNVVKKKMQIRRGKENYVFIDKSPSRSKPSSVTLSKRLISNCSTNNSRCEKKSLSKSHSARVSNSSSLSTFEKHINSSNDLAHFEIDESISNKLKQVGSPNVPVTFNSIVKEKSPEIALIDASKDLSGKADDDNDSVVVISNTSVSSLEDSSAIRKQNSVVKLNQTVIDISSSNNSSFFQKRRGLLDGTTDLGDVLDNSLRTHILTKERRKKNVGRIETLPEKPQPELSSSRYKDIEKWLEDNVLLSSPPLSTSTSTVPRSQSKFKKTDCISISDDSKSTRSAERLLNDLYGSTWQKDKVLIKKSQTEPRNPKRIGSDFCIKKPTSTTKILSSSSDEEFDHFLHNVRQNFESTRQNLLAPRMNSFIDDEDVENDSLGFYQATSNKITSSCKKIQSERKKIGAVVPKRLFILDDSSSDSSVEEGIRRKTIFKSVSKKFGGRNPGQAVAKFKVPVQKPTSSPPKVFGFLRSLSASPPAAQCHPRAQIFKADFKNNKEKLSAELFALYNRVVFDNKLSSNMKIEWNKRMNRTAGFCYNRRAMTPSKQSVRSSRIELSTKVCDTADRLRDTLIHEMCHAAAWVVDNSKGGHGPQWKAWATKAMQRFPDLPPIRRCHDYKIEFKYTYKCTKCGYSIGRHSKSLNLTTKRCGYCLGTFEILVNTKRKKIGTNSAVTSTPRTPRNPSGFALFVKENYSTVKKSRSDLKHGDVMKLLGQQFSAVKLGPSVK